MPDLRNRQNEAFHDGSPSCGRGGQLGARDGASSDWRSISQLQLRVVINRGVGQTLTIQAHPEDGGGVPHRNNAVLELHFRRICYANNPSIDSDSL